VQWQGGFIVGAASAPASTPASTSVSVSAATYTAPAGVLTIALTGSGQTVTANNLGDTITSDNGANHLIGGTGADTFIIGRGGDVVTGGGGQNDYVFNETPWAGAVITDFTPGQDQIDLRGMMAHYGYAGTNPVADGHLSIVSDGAGDTQIWFNMTGLPLGTGNWLVATLDHVVPSSVHYAGGWIAG
jgi:Ca2+-binding RTX toxin-like protein